MKDTPIYIRTKLKDEKAFAIIAGAMSSFDNFGEHILDRRFNAAEIPRDLPDPEKYIVDGRLAIDHYRGDLWDLYSRAPGKSIFTLDLVENPLITSNGRNVFASSVQFLDLNTGKVLSPNYAAVILSTNPLFLSDEPEQKIQARAYLLALHELGHLALGNQDICKDDSCINSHPSQPRKSLEEKISQILQTGKAPICSVCELKSNEFGKS